MNKNKYNIQSILEAIDKIEGYIKPFNNAKDFYNHTLTFEATMMNFIIIAQMVDRLSDDFKENYHEINWTKIKSLRNIIAHDYLGINAAEIWAIITIHLVTLKHNLNDILLHLD